MRFIHGKNLRTRAYAPRRGTMHAGIPSLYTDDMHTKSSAGRPNVQLSALLEIIWNAYSSSQIRFMHSQRADSSTVSTGLSTKQKGKSDGFTRFSQELSTLSTAYPQPLSTSENDVDIHVDSYHGGIQPVYKYDEDEYICMFVHVRTELAVLSGLPAGRKAQGQK